MPWNYIKHKLRDQYLDLLSRAFGAAEGQEILARSLPGLPAALTELSPRDWKQAELEYPELENTGAKVPSRQREDVVFITARFRSGSTLLWNLFRQLPDCMTYYEPLNERQWFDPQSRGTRVDRSHRNIPDYWREYAGLEHLGDCFDTRWNDHLLYLGADSLVLKMLAYLDTLIDHAAGRPVLQFNRMDFRLPWLRKHFPQAKIVHLVRHPRASWYSSLMSKEPCPRDISIADFAPFDALYLLPWMRDLRHYFPVLADPSLSHPYDVYYCIWKLSHAFGSHYANYHLTFESLVTEPEKQIASLLSALDMDPEPAKKLSRLIQPIDFDAWRAYADDAWFQSREAHCNQLLEDYYPALAGSGKLSSNEVVSPL